MGGYISLSYNEIHAYMQTTHTKLNSWEVLTIKKLSQAYCNQTYNKDINAIAPYFTTKEKSTNSSSIRSLFAGVAKVVSPSKWYNNENI